MKLSSWLSYWLVFVSVFINTQFKETALAQTSELPTGYIKKIVVFPIETPRGLEKIADAAWWKIRETLTDTKRFTVASKRFLVQKDTFQPRSSLNPSDAILLGDLLDTNALLTIAVKGRELKMNLYSRADGSLLWTSDYTLHQSLPIEKQLEEASAKLTNDLIASIPYHGTQVLDPLIGKTVFQEGDLSLAKVDVGSNSRITEGDSLQWIDIKKTTVAPLFGGGGEINVIAEGVVVKNESGILLVEIKRARELNSLMLNNLVRSQKESEFLTTNFKLSHNRAAPELKYTPLPQTQPANHETKPLVSALTFIGTLVGFILLAF